MKQWLVVSVLCMGINACSRSAAPSDAALVTPAAAAAPMAATPEATVGGVQAPTPVPDSPSLAFDRVIRAKARTDQIRAVYEKLLEVCQADTVDACQQMTSTLETGPGARADIKFRVFGGGVGGLRATLDKNGDITGEDTTVEDVGAPATDNARHIAQLKAYLDSVEAMRSKPGNDLDTLMRLTKEVASTQTDIDQLSASNANLADRARVQNLEIIVTPSELDEKWAPIGRSLGSSISTMGNSFAVLVALLAYALPWMILAIPVYYVARRFMRR